MLLQPIVIQCVIKAFPCCLPKTGKWDNSVALIVSGWQADCPTTHNRLRLETCTERNKSNPVMKSRDFI